MKWLAIAKSPYGTNSIWANEMYPNLFIRHCGHATALRPYYIDCNLIGENMPPKFKRLQQAIEFIESRCMPCIGLPLSAFDTPKPSGELNVLEAYIIN